MDGYQEALKLLPPEIVGVFRAYHGQAEELRLRRGQAPHVYDGCRELALDHVPLTELDLRRVLERATGASLHTAATALRRGYICSRGLRIGVCGSTIIRGGEMEGFREFSSIAIRIPRECRGICADAVDTLCGRQRFGCIILGAPGSGKTTALRDMIRLFSERGYRVGVADERGEISGDGVERIKSGYYSLGYRKKSEEEIIPVLFPDGVLCMESGLYYQGYLKERPYIWSIAVDKNTSKSRFKMDYPIVHPYYTETKVLEMGVETFDMNGQKIKIYEKERLICDCLKYEDKLDADSLKKGLLAFIKDEEKDIAKLMMYARERRVVEKVRNRIGVWL